MNLYDKDFVLRILRMPSVQLSLKQVNEIERIIDGRRIRDQDAPEPKLRRPYYTFEELVTLLGVETRKGVVRILREAGVPPFRFPGGKHAIGYARSAVDSMLAVAAAGGDAVQQTKGAA